MDNEKDKNSLKINVHDSSHVQESTKIDLFENEVKSEINKITKISIFPVTIKVTPKHENIIYALKKFVENRKAKKVADKLLQEQTLKDKICPMLLSGANDFSGICKSLVPVFTTLAITGNLPFSVSPFIAATAIVLIAKMGISAYCREYKK
jgi:hypothetical protein